MARKLTDEKLEEMWGLYKEKQSLYYVREKSNISYETVKKYCQLLKWDERIEKIQVEAHRMLDKKEVAHRVRHAELGKLMQGVGADKLEGMTKKDIKKMKVRDAKDLLKDGIGIEREAVGDVAPDTVVVLALPVGLENL